MKIISNSAAEATININGYIGRNPWAEKEDENSLVRIQRNVNAIKALGAAVITVNIHSLGGDANHALAIHDALKEHSAKIITKISGMCASAATVIFMAGDERKMSENALMLLHKCWGLVIANENELEAELELQRTLNQRLVNLYTCENKQKEAEIKTLMNENNGNGKWITASEAKALGLVTEVYVPGANKKSASFSKAVFNQSKLPELPPNYDFLLENDQQTLFADFLKNLKNEIKQLFTIDDSPFTQNTNNQINTQMKTLFPTIAALFALGDDVQFDKEKGVTLNETQLKNLETELAKITALQTEKTALQAEKTSLEAKIAEKDTKIAALQKIVDKVPVPVKKLNGNDADDNAEPSFEDTMKNDTYYQSVSAEYGLKL